MPASEVFFNQYLTTILWIEGPGSDEDENDDKSFQDKGFTRENFDPENRKTLRAACDKFYDENAADLELWREHFGNDEEAGHDFWLTAQGHGEGFWSRFAGIGPADLEAAGDRLTEAAKKFEVNGVYLGDDGQVWVH